MKNEKKYDHIGSIISDNGLEFKGSFSEFLKQNNIKQKFNNPSISILSHEHSIELLKKYEGINKCITYPYKESFDFSRKAKFDDVNKFDHTVVMVGNLSGCGFQNVLFFALSLALSLPLPPFPPFREEFRI